VTLPDGRRISAERVTPAPGEPTPAGALEVELDADGLPDPLVVRWPASGDRFRPLGAPGSKRLRRFLADRGVPREERGTVPLVFAGSEVVWVVGVELGERGRVGPATTARARLTMHAGHPGHDRLAGGRGAGFRRRLAAASPDTPRIPDALRSR